MCHPAVRLCSFPPLRPRNLSCSSSCAPIRGQIGKKELQRALIALGFEAPSAAVAALFASFDRDGGGSIEYKELHRAIRREAKTEHPHMVAEDAAAASVSASAAATADAAEALAAVVDNEQRARAIAVGRSAGQMAASLGAAYAAAVAASAEELAVPRAPAPSVVPVAEISDAALVAEFTSGPTLAEPPSVISQYSDAFLVEFASPLGAVEPAAEPATAPEV